MSSRMKGVQWQEIPSHREGQGMQEKGTLQDATVT